MKFFHKVLMCVSMLSALAVLSGVSFVSAHEVYVLDSSEINTALLAPTPDFIATIQAHLGEFVLWGFVTIAIIAAIFFISVSRPIERFFGPFFLKIKHYAPHIAQVTIGVALIASGYYRDIFGVELPLSQTFGIWGVVISYLLIVVGAMLVVGLYPRVASIIVVAIFAALVFQLHLYMLNYATYLGEALTLAIFGGAHTIPLHGKGRKGRVVAFFSRVIGRRFYQYKFLIMRVLFGISLVYASLYAKFFHGALALEVVSKYNLTNYFHFDPVFLVFGAMTIEILLGIFFMIGFEIRFTSLFFLVFLTLSLLFFGEAVWPHLILIEIGRAHV